jgi:AcrR family transcriptional regulator
VAKTAQERKKARQRFNVNNDVIAGDFTARGPHVNSGDMARKTYHHGNLPEALLAASERLIERSGVAGFSLREAARQIGVDPASTYRHFRDRDAVLAELARRGFGAMAASMERALGGAGDDPAARLEALGCTYVSFALERPAMFRTMFGPTGREARDPRHHGAHPEGRSPYNLVEAEIAAWAAGRTVAVEQATLMLWAAAHGLASLFSDGAVRLDAAARDATTRALVRSVLAGLGPRARGRR